MGGVADDWKESVDRQLGQLHGDVRAMLKAGFAAVALLVTVVGGLYLYTNSKFEIVNARLGGIEVQQARMDAKLDLLLERSGAPIKR